ncbi:MAG: putative Ig domain-containing protein, partial [Synergistaceae bacterium]|nr:putative Ig domain-containing protein [Synergistaceae bacterium]
DYANTIQQTSDGGYIVAGETYSNDGDVTGNQGHHDVWVVKLNTSGDIEWQKCLGGSNGDNANSIQQTSDGGYIVAGSTNSTDGDMAGNQGNASAWVAKLKPEGGGLTITTTTLPNSAVWTSYSATLTATGASGPITWTLDSGYLPSGLTLWNSGTIFGRPTMSGTFNFTVKAASGTEIATKALSITIASTGGGLTITTTTLPNGAVGTPYSVTLTAAGDSWYPAFTTWTLDSGSLPLGLTLASNGTIFGTPATNETADFTVKADRGTESATQALSITITSAGGGLTITTTTLPNGTVGTLYSAVLEAAGGSGAVIWTLDGGSLPSGLTLSSGGTISGTPTLNETADFTVRATSGTESVTKVLSITIASAGDELTITTTSLLNGTVGTPYSAVLEAAGGSGVVIWTLDGGSLPLGLTLSSNGTISGTPAASGTANFTVRAASVMESVTKDLSITIASAGNSDGDGCNSGFFSAASALLALFSLLVVRKKRYEIGGRKPPLFFTLGFHPPISKQNIPVVMVL